MPLRARARAGREGEGARARPLGGTRAEAGPGAAVAGDGTGREGVEENGGGEREESGALSLARAAVRAGPGRETARGEKGERGLGRGGPRRERRGGKTGREGLGQRRPGGKRKRKGRRGKIRPRSREVNQTFLEKKKGGV